MSSLYTDTNRVFMEYIDNALDSAEEYFYDKNTDSYSRPINIKVWFQATSYRDAILIVEDNCSGIADITSLTNSLGNSNKEGNPALNGQFGYGIYSFMAICNELQITSKTRNSYQVKSIQLNSSMFDKSDIDDVELGNVIHMTIRNNHSWTRIKLRDFKKDRYKEISVDKLKDEIEKHFENILRRGNLTISIQQNNQAPVICIPFNYNQYAGPEYSKIIDRLYYTYSKKLKTEKEISISECPISIYLKIIKGKAIERKPVFIIKGRRILEVVDLKAFKTISKGEIWSHPNVTGYIDVTGCLKPTIARNEFIHSSHTKALFYTLLKLEPEIKELIKDSLGSEVESKFKKLESILNSALNDITKQDNLKNQDTLSDDGESKTDSSLLKDQNQLKRFAIKTLGDNTVKVEFEENSEFNRRRGGKSNPISPSPWVKTFLELPIEISESSKKHLNNPGISNGLNIKIDNENQPQKNSKNILLRSLLVGSNIIIYRKHPGFEERLDCTIHGVPRITPALITYLCSEILLHYKSMALKYLDKKSDFKNVILDFIDSLYQLESKLAHIKNKKISDFS